MWYSPSTNTSKSTAETNEAILRPPQIPLDVENYPQTPEGLELQQVHIYVRHGERTPVGVRMAAPPASIPEHWMMCKMAHRFRRAVMGIAAETEADRFSNMRKFVERRDGVKAEGECLLGELTDTGRRSTSNFGKALRHLYVEKLGFLPDILRDSNDVYFRSTNIPRTIESLEQIMHGLYPINKCDRNVIIPLLIRNGKDENLMGNTFACKRLEILQVGFAQAAASLYNPTLEPLDKKLSKYLGGNPIRLDGKPRASGILDTIRAAAAHGVKIPPEFEDNIVTDVIERAVVNEWFADKTEEVRRLGMGRLLEDLSRKMQAKVDNGTSESTKLLVHSTHDTAIAALCSTLDVYDEKWPAFTAAITFELFKKTNTEGSPSYLQSFMSPLKSKSPPEHYVRMRYQNKNTYLPICAKEGKHLPGSPEFCTFEAFRARVKELIPEDWDAECAPAGRSST